MTFFIIFSLCILAATKVLTQSRYAKKNTKGIADSAMFNALVFATMGLIAFLLSDISEIDLSLFVGAAFFGFFNVSFQMLYQIALSCGPTSITALIASLASIVPLIASAVFYKEPLSPVNLVGVVLIIVTLVINADIKRDIGEGKPKNVSRKWFLLIMLAFCGNSLGMISQQLYAKTTGATSSSAFVACSSCVASVVALAVYGVLRIKGERMSYKLTPMKLLPCVAVGAVLGVFQIIHTYAMSVIPGTVLFPTYSAGATIAIALGSTLVFRERLSRAQCFSLIFGIAAIVLINI
ncbi:MAG: hypothetical protein IJF32_10465 [Oscillospiraceae bacterium]|nr:hypothetical protein [Oscillospiraceae bacterium]